MTTPINITANSQLLKFPEVPLTRIVNTQWFDSESAKTNYWDGLQPKDFELEMLEKLMDNPDGNLFEIYERVDDELVQQELAILKANYDQATFEQKYLAHLFIKPSVIFSAQYEALVQGKASFGISDCLFNDSVARVSYKYDEQARRTIYYFDRKKITKIILKLLPYPLKVALYLGGYVEFYFNKYSGEVPSLLVCLFNFMSEQTPESIDCVVQKFAPYFVKDRDYPNLMKPIVSYQVVPYFLNAFDTKTKSQLMTDYFQQHPQTVLNETVYLLFSKQTNDTLKKAKKNAKPFFDWLIEHHKSELVATLQAYDQQLKKPTIIPFFEQYLAQRQNQSQQLDTAKNAKLDDFMVNEHGIPTLLLSNDWLKLTTYKSVNLPTAFNLSNLPSLVLASNQQALPSEAQQTLLKMLFISEIGNRFALLVPILAFFTPDSQQQLAQTLWERAEAVGKGKWLKGASAWLYNDDITEKVAQSVRDYEKNRKSIKATMNEFAILAEYALTRHTIPQTTSPNDIDKKNQQLGNQALRELFKLSRKARPSLRKVALAEIQRYAEKMGLTADELADRVLPTLGLNAQGKRTFDYGSRQFTLQLDSELNPTFIDNQGKKVKTLPKANANDDIEKATLAFAEFKAVKAELKAFKQDEGGRLEDMMASGRRIKWNDFNEFYIKNPLMLRMTSQLIWGIYNHETGNKEESTKLMAPFRVVETGEILDMDDNDLTISDDSLIGLVHPLELSDEQKAKFGQSLQDDNILQSFMQLARPIFRLTAEEQAEGKIHYFDGQTFATGSVIGLKNKGWTAIVLDAGGCSDYEKQVGDIKWKLHFTGFYIAGGVPTQDDGQDFSPIKIPDGASEIAISELIYTLDSLARLIK